MFLYLHHKPYNDILFLRDSYNYYKYKQICLDLDCAIHIT